MTITANLPDGRVLNFPDGTDPAVIQNTVKNMLGVKVEQTLGAEQSATDPNVDFVPTEENLAIQPEEQEAKSFADQVIGVGDAALTLATGATAGAGAFIGGTVEGAFKELTGQIERGEGQKLAEERASGATFSPRTEIGQDIVQGIGDVLGVLPPVLGTTPLNTLKPLVTGKAVTDRILRSPRAKRALLADEIRKGNPNIENVTKALDASGEIITRPASKRAVKILGGDHVAKGTVSVIENMSEASKSVLKNQLANIKKGRNEPLFGDANRPSNDLGKSILHRAVAIDKVNNKAGEAISKAAESLKDINVDIKDVNNAFLNDLNRLGVKFSRGDDGWVTPDFSRSKFKGGNQQEMTVLINDLLDGAPDFQTAHKLKRTIRDNIDYEAGVGGVGQVKGESKQLLKDLSSGIDFVLDSTSPKYKKANESFAKTIKLKNDFDKLMGKDIDLTDEVSASSILGNKAMRVDSNAPSGVVINKLFTDADSVLGEFNIRFKDDIPSIRHVTNKLNDAFKLAPSNSLKGNIISGGLDVAEAASGPVGAARVAASKLSQFKDPDFNKKLRAFESLISTQGKK
jgi:hypothetical protein